MANVPVPTIAIVTPTAADTVLGVQTGSVKRFTVSQLPVAAENLSGTTLAASVVNASLNSITPFGNVLSVAGRLSSAVPDGGLGLLISGSSKGLRVIPHPASIEIAGVDNTGVVSFQPLIISGSTVTLSPANGTFVEGAFSSSGNITSSTQVIAGASGGGTTAAFLAQSAGPNFAWKEIGAPANEGVWDFLVDDSILNLRTVSDDNNTAVPLMSFTRSGVTPGQAFIHAPLIASFAVDIRGGLGVTNGGSGLSSIHLTQLDVDPTIEMQRWSGTTTDYWGYRIRAFVGELQFQISDPTTIGSQVFDNRMTLNTNGQLNVGGEATPYIKVNGPASGISGGSFLATDTGGSIKTALGNYSAIHGGTFNDTPTIFGGSALHVCIGGPAVAAIFRTNTINLPLLPTSPSGLLAGDLWNDSGTVKIV